MADEIDLDAVPGVRVVMVTQTAEGPWIVDMDGVGSLLQTSRGARVRFRTPPKLPGSDNPVLTIVHGEIEEVTLTLDGAGWRATFRVLVRQVLSVV